MCNRDGARELIDRRGVGGSMRHISHQLDPQRHRKHAREYHVNNAV